LGHAVNVPAEGEGRVFVAEEISERVDIGALRAAGENNIATGIRRNARDVRRPLALLGLR